MSKQIERNYLEINSLEELVETAAPSKNLILKLVNPADFQLNKFFYKQIGRKYSWIDRLEWTDNVWIKYIENENVKTYVLKESKELVGYFEKIYHQDRKETEIAYLGILEEYFGKNYGSYLLSEAIKISFINKSKRVWVHTCSLDHKNALKNYQNRGMKIFKKETINLNL